jgi:phosphoribosylformylglycinamidine synthase PurS subunit
LHSKWPASPAISVSGRLGRPGQAPWAANSRLARVGFVGFIWICASAWLRQRGIVDISTMMKARVTVTLKSGVLDPQGKAIEGALKSLGVGGIASVRQGKVFDVEVDGADKARAEAALKDAAEKLLANTVIENYRIEVLG